MTDEEIAGIEIGEPDFTREPNPPKDDQYAVVFKLRNITDARLQREKPEGKWCFRLWCLPQHTSGYEYETKEAALGALKEWLRAHREYGCLPEIVLR